MSDPYGPCSAADRRDLSLVDCTSFQLMRRLRRRAAFAFDGDFAAQRFELLLGAAAGAS